MAPTYVPASSIAWTDIACMVWRNFDQAGAPWRVSLDIRMMHGDRASHPSAKAVIDDFGTLVIVGDWR